VRVAEVEGVGGVGFLRRPPVRDLNAPNRAEDEEDRSGVCGASFEDGDISLGAIPLIIYYIGLDI
jgi:hypothetical protein